MLRSLCLIVLLFWAQVIGLPSVMAATNSVTAGIGGINNGTLAGGDGTGTGQITINSVNLALIKQARDLTGIVLPGGSNVTSGQAIYFVLFVDNITNITSFNIQITDLLDESQFTYVPNSIETTVVPTGSNDAAIWGGTWSSLTDSVGGPDDTASITDTGGPAGLEFNGRWRIRTSQSELGYPWEFSEGNPVQGHGELMNKDNRKQELIRN